MAETFVLEIEQDTDNYLWWAYELPDGTVADLSTVGDGYDTGWLQVRDKHRSEGGELMLSLTTDNGGVVIEYQLDDDGEAWSGYCYVSAAATSTLEPWGDAVCELRVGDPAGRRLTIVKGGAQLNPATVDESEV